MADYITISDAELLPEAPLTTSLAFRWRDNPLAMFEGAAGAPRIQSGAYGANSILSASIAEDAITTRELALNAVTQNNIDNAAISQAKLANSSVGRPQLKTQTNAVAGTLVAGAVSLVTLDAYAFFPCIGGSSTNSMAVRAHSVGASADSPSFKFVNTGGVTDTFGVAWRYIVA